MEVTTYQELYVTACVWFIVASSEHSYNLDEVSAFVMQQIAGSSNEY